VKELIRPDRRALLEFDAVLGEIERLRNIGDRPRFEQDNDYRWAIHRLWIAADDDKVWRETILGTPSYRAQARALLS
jgi:hypothetical protein